MATELLDSKWFPLIYLAILIISIVIGIALSVKLGLHQQVDWRSAPLFAPILSFFSLLLAFTLSLSASSNKERANLIHQHADALSDLNQKSFLLNDTLRASVKEYVINCFTLKMQASKLHGAARQAMDVKSFWVNEKFLKKMVVFRKSGVRFQEEASIVADNVNKIMALDNQLHYSNQDRTPVIVMILLLLCSWAIGFLLGLGHAIFRKYYFMGPAIFMTLTSLTVMAIQDMDTPHTGIIKPPYDIYGTMLRNIDEE